MGSDERERHFNLHTTPEVMAGVYANFATVSHSDYEFTLTFSRVDHEVEADEVPGVVVSRISLSPQAMRELIDAMEDNWSKCADPPRHQAPAGDPRPGPDFNLASRASSTWLARCPVLVERDDELRRSRGSRARARSRLVVITGEAGTGKSRLAREFAGSLPAPWSVCTATITRTARGTARRAGRAAAGAGRSTTRTSSTPARSPRCPRSDGVLDRARRSGSACTPRAAPRCERWPALVAERARVRVAPHAALARGSRADGGRDGPLRGRGRLWPHGRQPVLGRAGARRVRGGAVDGRRGGDGAARRPSRRRARPGAARSRSPTRRCRRRPARGWSRTLDAAWAALATPVSPAPDLSLRHALVGEAIRARLGPDERARWHAPRGGGARARAGRRRTASRATGPRPASPSGRRRSRARPPPTCAHRARPGGRSSATSSPLRRPRSRAAGAVRGGRGDRGADRRVRGDAALDRGRRALLPRRRPRRSARSACGSTRRSTTCPCAAPPRSATSRSSGCSSTPRRRWSRVTARPRAAFVTAAIDTARERRRRHGARARRPNGNARARRVRARRGDPRRRR